MDTCWCSDKVSHVLRSCVGLSISGLAFLFFFFFQAEDGIRDYKVTGVQTCALPILSVYLALDGPNPDPNLFLGIIAL